MEHLPPEVLQGASMDSSGTFTVAFDKARDKLKRFQLPDPRHYILQIMQAIVASGATEIDATVGGWAGDLMDAVPEGVAPGYRITIEFDGPGYSRKELATLFDFIFESQRERQKDRLREMALGMLSCQALDPSFVRLASGGAEWVRRSNDDVVVRTCPKNKKHVFELRRLGAPSEPELLRDTCQALPIRLRLNEDIINLSNQLASATPWPAWTFESGSMKGCIGLPYTPLSDCRIYIFRYGVRISGKNESRLYPPVVIMLDHPGLRKNVSQSDIVEDQVYQECLNELQQMLLMFAGNLRSRRIPSYQQTSVQSFLVDLVSEWIPTPLLLAPPEEVPADLQPLFKMPIFADRRGTRRSLADIIPFFKRDGFVSLYRRKLVHAEMTERLWLYPQPPEEVALRTLFERLVDFTQGIGGSDPLFSTSSLVRKRVSVQWATFDISIENAFPLGQSLIRVMDKRFTRRTERRYLNGWSLCVEAVGRGDEDPQALMQQALDVLVEHAESVYQSLFADLAADHLTWGADQDKRRRALEHLSAWWSWLFAQAGACGVSLSGKEVWGQAMWQARIFDTRSGPPVSLADMERWVGDGRSIILMYGGSRLKDDYALDASPQVGRLLRLIFPEERVIRASLRAPYWEERREQRILPGAAERKFLTPPARLLEVEPAELPTIETPQATVDPAPAPSLAEVEAPVVEEAAPETETVAQPVQEPVVVPPPPPPPEPIPVLPTPVSMTFVQYRFHSDTLKGDLELGTAVEPLSVQVGDGPRLLHPVFDLPVGGRVEAERAPGEWEAKDSDALRHAVVALFERLAAHMREVGDRDPWFPAMRSLLMRFLLTFRDSLQARLGAPKLQDPLVNLRFLPLVGGGLASLLTLWTEARIGGYVAVMPAGSDMPPRDFPPAEVGGVIPMSFYEALFARVVEVTDTALEANPQDRLLLNVRRELKRMVGKGEATLDESLLSKIDWAPIGSPLVQHDPSTGCTWLNPNHKVWSAAVRRLEADRALLPLLVAAVYNAIQQCVPEGTYDQDISFLQALVEEAQPEKALPRSS